ncbi:WD domain G-beta repeat domain containing protein [Plasmodium coatneyi]|uniref:WD domain G-beta repeat domain containing protein n=1 Tax=Plasmodium coatneyi TaxID=208452 RepID=A0A1B1DSC8_9APIC|nr:WD domain G-beta repeat domain containing protein [Plasmodium coatneyi]ANQ05690.1 WD domain G-beta repeat domain containing protein [Plasmodium coatneyi]
MELEHFDIGINRVEQRDEKVYYVILIQYKDLKYETSRRYSEFEELHWELLHMGFSALPNLPKKKLMAYKNVEYINYRKKVLNSYLHNLFIRADVRCCALFLNFILFYDKINLSVEVVKTKLLNSIGSQKFSLSDLYINEKYNFIICVYEDKSNLSKLGKLWSIIEPDIVGEIKIFTYNNDLTSTFCETYKEQTVYKARNIVCAESQNEVIISGDDGKIHIYKIDTQLLTLTYVKNIPCHNDTILKMMSFSGDLFCTCGYDNAFRLLRFSDYKILSGGRCNKRLDKDKITTCHLLNYGNIVLGTDCSVFFIYNMMTNPPLYLDTKKLKNGEKINCFANTDKYLFIGYDNIIACYNYHYNSEAKNGRSLNLSGTFSECVPHEDPPGGSHNYAQTSEKEPVLTKLIVDNNMSAQYIPPLLFDNTVLSLSVNKEKKVLYAGYEDAIVIWSITSGLIISAFHGHTNGVHFLNFLSSSGFLLSGGDGGNLKVWKNDIDNFQIWKPKRRRSYKTNEPAGITPQSVYAESSPHRNSQHNNFNFNESEDGDDPDNRSNPQSETMSIDHLLGETNKKYDYQVYDTSNYKKDLLNYNASTNINSVNSSRSNVFYDKSMSNAPQEFLSDASNLDVCILTNLEDKGRSVSYDCDVDENFSKADNSFHAPHYGQDFQQNHLDYCVVNEDVKFDHGGQNEERYQHGQYNLRDHKDYGVPPIQRDEYETYYEKGGSYRKTEHDDNHHSIAHRSVPHQLDVHGENYNSDTAPQVQQNSDGGAPNSIDMKHNNEDDQFSNLKRDIVYVSDEDDDLISAFR